MYYLCTLIIFVLFQDTRAIGSLLAFICFLFWSYKYVIKNQAIRFQNTFLVRLENIYNDFLSFALSGIRPFLFLAGTFLLFITSIVLMGIFPPKIEFFQDNEPQQILVYLEYPEGNKKEKTNETLIQIESEIYEVINNPKYLDGDYNFLVESAISQVGEGAGNPETDAGGTGEIPHKALITMTMREFKYRNGLSSENLRSEILSIKNAKFHNDKLLHHLFRIRHSFVNHFHNLGAVARCYQLPIISVRVYSVRKEYIN